MRLVSLKYPARHPYLGDPSCLLQIKMKIDSPFLRFIEQNICTEDYFLFPFCSETECFDQHLLLTVQRSFSLCRLCLIPHESLIIHHYYFLDTYLYSILNI